MITGVIDSAGKAIRSAFTDDFTRADSSDITTSAIRWQELTGDWTILSNSLSTGTAPSSNPMAVVRTNTYNADVQVGKGASGFGWGVAFWAHDSDNWYAAVTDMTSSVGYSCPSGGTLSGTNCVYPSTYAATASTSYSCPSGGTSDGAGTCVRTCWNTCGGECNGYAQGDCGCANCWRPNAQAYVLGGSTITCYYNIYRGWWAFDFSVGSTCDPAYGGPGGFLGTYGVEGYGCYALYQPITNQDQCCGWLQGPCNSWTATYSCEPYACNYGATATVAYSCPSGGSVSGANCVYPSNYSATSTTNYNHVITLKKAVAGTVSTVSTSNTISTTSSSARASYVRAITNGTGISITAPMDNATGTMTINITEAGAKRAKKQGVALSSVTATAATTVDNYSYAPY